MSDRFPWTLIVPALLCAPAVAQSNVRQPPLTALLPADGFELAHGNAGPAARVAAPAPRRSRWEDLAAVPDAQQPVAQVDLRAEGFHRPSADFSDAPGSMSVQRGGWDAEFLSKAAADRAFAVRLHTEASFYDFGGATDLVPGSAKPFNDVYDTRLGMSLCVADTEFTSWFCGFELALSGEDEARVGDALSVGGVGGLHYQACDDLAFTFGLSAQTRLEDQTWVLPLLGFAWDINDDWKLVAEGWRVRLEGDLGELWSVSGEATYEARQYRLNQDNPLPEGVARDEQITVGGRLWFRPAQGVRLSLGGGIVAWQELTLLDGSGAQVREVEADAGPYATFGLELAF